MKRILASLTLLVLLAGVQTAHSQVGDTQAPVIAYPVADYTTVYPNSYGLVRVPVYVTDDVGLRSVSLSGPNCSAYANLPAGTRWFNGSLYWSTRSFPTGDYVFTCTAMDWAGNRSTQTLVLHLQK